MLQLFPCSACQKRSPQVRKPAKPTDPAKIAEAVEEHRRKGNAAFQAKEFTKAVAEYSEAISFKAEPALYVNRSIALRRLLRWQESSDDAAMAARLEPANEKAHYAQAIALQHLGKLPEALAACEAGLAAQSDHKALLELKKTISSKLAEQGKLAANQGGINSAKPKAKPKPKGGPKEKKIIYSNDYSKWDDFTDEEEEEEDEDADDDGAGAAGDSPNDVSSNGAWKHRSEDQRAVIVEQFMNMVRESREKMHKEAEWQTNSADLGKKKITNPNLPKDYRRMMGTISVEQLGKFTCSNDRMLVSVYGDIFDVSIRSDMYGYGKNSWMSGRDITWSIVTGKEEASACNKFYDLFKSTDKELERMMRVVCFYLVSFKDEFGEPVGRLDKYNHEQDLPPPPVEEAEACKQQ